MVRRRIIHVPLFDASASVVVLKKINNKYAQSSSTNLEFKNLCGVLTDASAVASTVTVSYSTAKTTTAEGKVFYIAVPA